MMTRSVLLPKYFVAGSDEPVALAPGQPLTEVLLFDNGKLAAGYGQYDVIFAAFAAALDKQSARVGYRSKDLLECTTDDIETLGKEIAAEQYSAAIIALCDANVARPSAMLALQLELRGVPTTLIGRGGGGRLARAYLRSLGAPIPSYTLNAIRTATREEIASEVEQYIDGIISGLADAERSRRVPAANGSAAPASAAERATSTINLAGSDLSREFSELARRHGLGDGLPLFAPTQERVAELVAAVGEPEDIVWPVIPPRRDPLVLRDVAIVAAMAGCEAEWMWAVTGAYRAMVDPLFRLFLGAGTSHPCGTLVFFSGARATESGIEAGPGCLGPGFPANACIGRAVALAYSTFFGARPGDSDLTTQGSPAEYSYCCAENIAASPWPGLHEDLGWKDGTTVTVLRCEGPRNVMDGMSMTAEGLLVGIADTVTGIASNNSFYPAAQSVVFLNPEHAHIIASSGLARGDVQTFLFEHARVPKGALSGRGVAPQWPDWFAELEEIPVVTEAADFVVAVAGDSGVHSAVAVPWGASVGATVGIEG